MKTTGIKYTLANRDYFDLLGSISEQLDRSEINYALVGGTGVQARIANIVFEAKKEDILTARLELLFRGTKDFDLAATSNEEQFIRFFNEFQALNPNATLGSQGKRKQRQITYRGSKTPMEVFLNYEVGPQDFTGLDDSFYYDCVNHAELLRLKNGNKSIRVYVARPEHLITSKLTRYDPKDILDIGNLLKVMQIYGQKAGKLDSHLIKTYLEKADKVELIGRLDEVRKQVLKE